MTDSTIHIDKVEVMMFFRETYDAARRNQEAFPDNQDANICVCLSIKPTPFVPLFMATVSVRAADTFRPSWPHRRKALIEEAMLKAFANAASSGVRIGIDPKSTEFINCTYAEIIKVRQ